MINSILLLGSCYNKYKKVSLLFTIALLFNLFLVQFGRVKIGFFLCNFTLVLIISLINKKITNKTIKFISSIFSILIWSICIDIICFYMFPIFNSNLSLFGYIMNGIAFNLKYVAFNGAILILFNSFEYAVNSLNDRACKKKIIYLNNVVAE